jgi:hypothetical protein
MTKKEEEKKEKHLAHFRDALQKMSMVSLSFQQGKIKYVAYSEQTDALIDASGWSREDFQQEVENRRKKLNQQH